MDYPEKQIYSALISELKDNEAYFNEQDHLPPAHYDWDREQYLEVKDEKEFPFHRPAIFIRFGELEFTPGSGFNRRGTVPIEIIIVQDKYVDSGDGMESQPEYLKLLEYKYLVNTVLDHFRAECIGFMNMVSMVTDHDNRNLHVERIRYTCQFTLSKKTTT